MQIGAVMAFSDGVQMSALDRQWRYNTPQSRHVYMYSGVNKC